MTDSAASLTLAHLAELHLGARGPAGSDELRDREGDLEAAFHRAVDVLVARKPSLIVIVGDLFDHPSVSARPLGALLGGLWQLRDRLPGVPVALIAGERDVIGSGRVISSPLDLVAATCPWVHVATDSVEEVWLADRELRLVLVPHAALQRGEWRGRQTVPDPKARWNVLATYARVREARHGDTRQPHSPVPASRRLPARLPTVESDSWSYVALGGSHRNRRYANGVWQAGSLERVGRAPWTEVAVDKGFVLFDLENRSTRFERIPGRPLVTLAAIRAAPGDRSTLTRRILEAVDGIPGGVEGKIVRMRFEGVDLDDLAALEGEVLRPLRRQAFHLSIDLGTIGLDALAASPDSAGGTPEEKPTGAGQALRPPVPRRPSRARS